MIVKVNEARTAFPPDSECFDCGSLLQDLDGDDMVAVYKIVRISSRTVQKAGWSDCRPIPIPPLTEGTA